MAATAVGVVLIRRKRVPDHAADGAAYGLVLSAVTFRTIHPALLFAGVAYESAYVWANWPDWRPLGSVNSAPGPRQTRTPLARPVARRLEGSFHEARSSRLWGSRRVRRVLRRRRSTRSAGRVSCGGVSSGVVARPDGDSPSRTSRIRHRTRTRTGEDLRRGVHSVQTRRVPSAVVRALE